MLEPRVPDPRLTPAHMREEDAPRALESLGLDVDVLRDAVINGVHAARNITPTHPVTARGFTQWSETVGSLRSRLLERGWTREDPQNSPRATSPDGLTSVMVIGGNTDTGKSLDINPVTARRRGPSTKAAVDSNLQLALDIPEMAAPKVEPSPLTWVLLYYVSYTERAVRMELSLPTVIHDKVITEWRSRILLPAYSMVDVDIPSNATGPDDDVDFEIIRIS